MNLTGFEVTNGWWVPIEADENTLILTLEPPRTAADDHMPADHPASLPDGFFDGVGRGDIRTHPTCGCARNAKRAACPCFADRGSTT
jgi:hypothetical protein